MFIEFLGKVINANSIMFVMTEDLVGRIDSSGNTIADEYIVKVELTNGNVLKESFASKEKRDITLKRLKSILAVLNVVYK